MADLTTQESQVEAHLRSVFRKSTSNPDSQTRDSGSSKSNHGQDESTTPTTKPPQGGQQPSAMPPMAPPPVPNFKATPTSARPPQPASSANSELPAASREAKRNGGREPASKSKQSAKDTTPATTRKGSHVELEQQHTTDDECATDEDSEPADRIAAFDWTELEGRYHAQMKHFREQEGELYQSFNDLCNYFYVWSETGHGHEVDRSFKRMKTQITLVQHNEDELENKRQHYVRVVEAFKSALHLLTNA